MVILSMEDPSPSMPPIKRSRDDKISPPPLEGTPKRDNVSKDTNLGSLTHFLYLPAILPFEVPNIPEEFAAIMAKEDISFILNLY